MARPPITRAAPYTPGRGQLAGQTFTSERQYRDALARAKGFASFRQQLGAAKPIASARAFQQLSPAERAARERALDALSRMRSDGRTLSQAAKAAGTTPEVVRKYAGSGLTTGVAGRAAPTAHDRLYRQMALYTPQGQIMIDVRDSRSASRIARYHNAVRRYIETGDDRALRAFRGKYVQSGKQRYPFITDRATLDRLAGAGELSFEHIYPLAA